MSRRSYPYEVSLFGRKLEEAGVRTRFGRAVLARLGATFTGQDLRDVPAQERESTHENSATVERAARGILPLAEPNYEVRLDPEQPVSQRVVFPSSPSQSNGIEDARFVRFQEDDGSVTNYATYTAYHARSSCRNC